jgi:hypothetical protein
MLAELQSSLQLSPTAHWNSFEQFRTSGANALTSIIPGTVGTLHTKTGQYRIVTEGDFQRLLGMARDVERLQQGLNVVTRRNSHFVRSICQYSANKIRFSTSSDRRHFSRFRR